MDYYVQCNYCGNQFKRLGLTRHFDSCRERQIYRLNRYKKEHLKKRRVELEEIKEKHRHEEEMMNAKIKLAQIESSRQVALKQEDTKQLAITSQSYKALMKDVLIIDTEWMSKVLPRLGYHTKQFGNYIRTKPKKNELIMWRDRSPHYVKDMLHLLAGGEYQVNLSTTEKERFKIIKTNLCNSYEQSGIDKLLQELD